MNQPPSSAIAFATRLRLQAQLMGHMVESARINPAPPTASIKKLQAAAQMLSVVNDLATGKH